MSNNTQTPEKPAHPTPPLTPTAPPIIERHWVRGDARINFAEQAAAAAFGRRWATPSERTFVDHPPPVLTEPHPARARNPVAAILDRKRRAA